MVNVGVIGRPANDGRTNVWYALLEERDDQLVIELVPLSYDHLALAREMLDEGLPQEFNALVGHKEAVQELPPGAVHLASSERCPFQMIRYGQNVYATQFHPEADGQVFADRIKIYRNHGYFKPEEADDLTATCLSTEVTVPKQILRRFIARNR